MRERRDVANVITEPAVSLTSSSRLLEQQN